METISVILPAYNRSHCIDRALRSVLAQDLPVEVCLGDDASTDETIEAAKRIFPELKVAALPQNTGAAAARNAALKLATGKYLAFLDSDDEWHPDKLRTQVEFLRARPEVLVCATGHLLQRQTGEIQCCPGKNFPDWPRSLAFSQSFHGASTPVVRREVLELAGMQDESLRVLEDWDWMLRISQKGPLHVLETPLATIHENRPSDPDATLRSTERFLAKHSEFFASLGTSTRCEILAQHHENAAKNQLLHGRLKPAVGQLMQSFRAAPFRNKNVAAGLALGSLDLLLGTRFLESNVRKKLFRMGGGL